MHEIEDDQQLNGVGVGPQQSSLPFRDDPAFVVEAYKSPAGKASRIIEDCRQLHRWLLLPNPRPYSGTIVEVAFQTPFLRTNRPMRQRQKQRAPIYEYRSPESPFVASAKIRERCTCPEAWLIGNVLSGFLEKGRSARMFPRDGDRGGTARLMTDDRRA